MGKRKFAKSIIYITLYPRTTPLDIFDVMKTLKPLTHTLNEGQHRAVNIKGLMFTNNKPCSEIH